MLPGGYAPGPSGGSAQAAEMRSRTSPSSCGIAFVWPMIGKKVRIRGPPRHDVLVEVRGDAGSGDLTLVHAEVESAAVERLARCAHPGLRERRDLRDLLIGRLVVARDVPVGAHEHVPAVVREQVEQHVCSLAAVHDERGLVLMPRCLAERAVGVIGLVVIR